MLQGLHDIGDRLVGFVRDRRAAVSIIAALSLPALIAFSSLVAEYGHQRGERDQRRHAQGRNDADRGLPVAEQFAKTASDIVQPLRHGSLDLLRPRRTSPI